MLKELGVISAQPHPARARVIIDNCRAADVQYGAEILAGSGSGRVEFTPMDADVLPLLLTGAPELSGGHLDSFGNISTFGRSGIDVLSTMDGASHYVPSVAPCGKKEWATGQRNLLSFAGYASPLLKIVLINLALHRLSPCARRRLRATVWIQARRIQRRSHRGCMLIGATPPRTNRNASWWMQAAILKPHWDVWMRFRRSVILVGALIIPRFFR